MFTLGAFGRIVNPPTTIHYCYGAWQDGFRDMKDAGVQFHEGVPTIFHLQKWFPKGGLLVLDDLMVERGEDKLKSSWKYSPNIHIIKISPCCICARTCFHQGNTQRVFQERTLYMLLPSKIHEIN